MLWLIWKQHRSEALVGALLVVVISIALINAAVSHSVISPLCVPCYHTNQLLSLEVIKRILLQSFQWLLPLLVGVFVGAPLVTREWERHTYRLIWTQSITRNRWLAVKLGVIAGILMLVFTPLVVLSIWDYSTAPQLGGNWELFRLSRGVALIGFGLFGLMLGVAIGTFVRRVVPAMALTVLVFLAVLIPLNYYSPYFIPPISHLYPIRISNNNGVVVPSDGLILDDGYADSAGHDVGEISTYCDFNATFTLFKQCLATHNLQWKVVYQPANRVWLLQWVELAVLLALSAALVPLTYWRLRQRRES